MGLRIIGGPFGGPQSSNFNATFKVGDYEGIGNIIDDNTLEVVVLEDLGKPQDGTTVPVQISLNGYDYSDSVFQLETYGIEGTEPKGGPHAGGTEIFISGYNFKEEYSAKCRFGIDESYEIVPAKVLNENRMMCIAPSKFKLPNATELPLDVPLEIGFSNSNTYYWTRTDNKFRFYKTPKISSISPEEAPID